MKYLFSAFVFIFMSFSANAAALSKDNFKCGNVKVKYINSNYDGGGAYYDEGQNVIAMNKHYFRKLSSSMQRFIFLHECGHARGVDKEYDADKYAYREARRLNLMLNVTEICKEMEDKRRISNVATLK